jgi:hypothetical protein
MVDQKERIHGKYPFIQPPSLKMKVSHIYTQLLATFPHSYMHSVGTKQCPQNVNIFLS